ncbi:decarboxylase [Desulfurococcus amylolyticus]|uniref:decarboxylase n=1 Tax=Desulfurococcus amylolyticus TaxID=94694 RepID=UPI0005B1EB31|nr:decarboxylase [Desulfurococcus amylolyticus]
MNREEWDINVAKELWGLNHSIRGSIITVDEEGYLVISLGEQKIRVKNLLEKHGFDVAYIRVLPLIERAIRTVYEAFTELAKVHGFKGSLQPVFPMKVNPIEVVIDAIWRYGEKYKWGFNTGSLGELELLSKYLEKGSRILIYDGVVSDSVIKILVRFKENGWRVIIDVESEHDLDILSKYPEFEIGLRIKPLFRPGGKWAHSAGLEGKFGLTVNTLMKLREEYKWIEERGRLLHIHPGSQIYKWSDMEAFINEVYNIFTQLQSHGFPSIEIVDLGGGLAYPYLDTRDGTIESPDYGLIEYFNHILKVFSRLEKHPTLVYEGGRYIVSAHRILVAKVVDIRPYSTEQAQSLRSAQVEDFLSNVRSIDDLKKLVNEYKKYIHKSKQVHQYTLEERELAEDVVSKVRDELLAKIYELVRNKPSQIESVINDPLLYKLVTSPSKRYILNFSIFADIPDSVLVNQYFQAVPAQRLNEKPDVLAVLGDLTCDSMGEINEYISHVKTPLEASDWFTKMDLRLMLIPGRRLKLGGVPLHLPIKGENYYIAILDTGAYQDPLAMKHNLIYGAPEIILDEKDGEVEVKIIEKNGKYL